MDITWNCPSCGQELSADDSAVGQEIECPTCAAAQVIPAPRSEPDLSMFRSAASESSMLESTAPPPSLMDAVTLAPAPPSSAPEPPKFSLPIPMPPQSKPAEPPAALPPGAGAEAPAAVPAEPKHEHKPYVVPQHEGLAERFVKKKAEAVQEGPKVMKMRIRAIKRNLCEEVGHDKFEEVVTAFLNKIGEENIISVTPVGYAYVNTLGQNLNDYGVLIVYRG